LAAISLGTIAVSFAPVPRELAIAVGCVVGASLPDQAELVFGYSAMNERLSVLRHRGITHTPWLWITLALLGAFIQPDWGGLISGLALGAILHIILDAMSPSGVPLLPGRPRWSFGHLRSGRNAYVYRTGTAGEFRVLVPLVAIATVAAIVRAPLIELAARHALGALIGYRLPLMS
jgi:membrane-bound metal-dependent hydrolase YbcI (DUF457 family)